MKKIYQALCFAVIILIAFGCILARCNRDKPVAPNAMNTGAVEGSTQNLLLGKDSCGSGEGDHEWGEWTTIREASTEKEGIQARICMKCYTEERQALEKLPEAHVHTYMVGYVEPTCTEQGYTLHACSCGDSFREDMVPALGHSYLSSVREPTCVDAGYTLYDCSLCGDVAVGDFIKALGHSFGQWNVAEAPSCTEAGRQMRICTICLTVEECEIEALGHDFQSEDVEHPGSEESYTVQKCTVCGYVYSDDQGDLAGHDFTDWEDVQTATCTQAGVKQRRCTICEYVETLETEATGHAYESETTPPSCTEDGYSTYTCTVCGDVHVADRTSALGHRFGEWTVIKEPTATETGTRTRSCTVCGKTETQTLKKKASIDLNNITPTDFFADLNNEARPVVTAILEAIKENYGKSFDEGEAEIVVYGAHDLSYGEYNEMISYLCFYFGVHYEPWNFVNVYSGSNSKVTIDIQAACEAETQRRAMMAEINRALAGFTAGTEEELVVQTYKYIAKRLSYSKEQGNATGALTGGTGNYNAYSTLFRLMLHRLGIESDICVGYATNGAYHAWNRVNFSSGQCKYYDLVNYEKYGSKYVGSAESYYTIVAINCYL